MIVEIDIEDGLDPSLQTRVDRQINFNFASGSANVRLLSVSLGATRDDGDACYSCKMDAHLHNGTRKVAQAHGKQSTVCIADTAARLARSIRRDHVLLQARQAMR